MPLWRHFSATGNIQIFVIRMVWILATSQHFILRKTAPRQEMLFFSILCWRGKM